MYKVIKFFTDLQDNGHRYNVGDVFPHDGATASSKRIEELSTNKNRQRVPLIEKVDEDPVEPVSEPIEPVPEPVIEKKTTKKRSRSKNAE